MEGEQAQAESEAPPIEQGRTRSNTNLLYSAPISSRSNRSLRLILLLLGSLLGPLPFYQPAFADVRSGGLGTRVNGGLAGRCTNGDCRITGGTDAGMNRFHRLRDFDTRGAINSVQIDSGSQHNVILGVTSPLGSFINKSVNLSSPAHLFLLSPGGIHLGSGANFVNTPNLTLSTANRLKFSGGDFDVHNTTVDQLAALGGPPLPGSFGLHRSIEFDDRNASPNQIKLEGIDIRIDQSLFVDAPSGGVKVIGSNLAVGDSAYKGGILTLTGETVDVDGSSFLDVAGALGGGTIHLGGSWQNSDSSVRQAVKTIVADGSVLDASATQSGDGGEIVAWSDIKNPNSITDVQGSLFAKGGVQSGLGGRVETSGYDLLVDGIHVDTRSTSGPAGEWLLDPLNIVIDDTSGTITPFTIESQLNTSSVTLTTTGAGGDVGNITVSDPIDNNGANSLTLDADNDIILNATVTRNGSGGLVLNAGRDVNIKANISATGSALLDIDAGRDISLDKSKAINGSTGASNVTLDAIRDISLQGPVTHSGNGNLAITSGGLTNLTIDGSITHSGSKDISLSSGTGITLAGDINHTGGGNVKLVSIVNGLQGPGDVRMGAASATLIIEQAGNSIWTGDLTGSGAGFTKRGLGELTLQGSFTQHTGNTVVEAGTLKMDVNAGVTQFGNNSPVNVLSGSSLLLSSPTSNNSISLGQLDSAGNILIDLSGGSLEVGDNNMNSTISGVISGTGRLIKIGSGELELSNLNNSFGTSASPGWPVLKISGGSVSIPDERALGSSQGADSIFIENNSTLEFTGTTTFNNARGIELSGTGGTIAVVSGATVTIPSALNGSATLTKTDPGTLELTNDNLGYTGSVLVSGGNLTVTGTNPLAGSISCSGGSSNRGCTVSARGGGGGGSGSPQTPVVEEPQQPPVTKGPGIGGPKKPQPPKKNVVTVVEDDDEDEIELIDLQDDLITTVDPLTNVTDFLPLVTSSESVADGQSEMSAKQFTNTPYQDIASGTKVAIEGVDVSLSESFVFSKDSSDEVKSDPKSPSSSSSDESLDSSTDSDDSGDSTSEGTSSESTDEASSAATQFEVRILAPDQVMTNFSKDINSKKAELMGVFGIMKSPSGNVTAPLIQSTLIDQRERVRNAP